MSTYLDLKAQGDALLAQAELLRKQEIQAVVQDIKAKMKEYGITAEELGAPSSKKRKLGSSKSKAPAKYQGPNGELWAGGLGRKPAWVTTLLAQGANMDDYLIDANQKTT